MQELYRAINKLEKQTVARHNQLAGQINQLHHHQAKELQKQQIAILKEILTHAYSKATAYANVVIIAGYAAFFTLWSSMKDKLPDTAMFTTAILMSLSVILFILFEVYKMIASSFYFRRLSKLFEQNKDAQFVITEFQEDGRKFDLQMSRIWVFVFVPTLVLGLSAASILVYHFFLKL